MLIAVRGVRWPVAPPPTTTSAVEPQLSRLWDEIAPMNSSKLYEVIAGIAMIITGLFLGYDELWGALMIVLGVVFLILWIARMGWML
jgi:Flp pilus assembly protein TadB